METLDQQNEQAKKVRGQGEGTASERTRTTITAGMKKKLKDLMGEFSDLRNTIQDEYREVVERRVYTVTGGCKSRLMQGIERCLRQPACRTCNDCLLNYWRLVQSVQFTIGVVFFPNVPQANTWPRMTLTA